MKQLPCSDVLLIRVGYSGADLPWGGGGRGAMDPGGEEVPPDSCFTSIVHLIPHLICLSIFAPPCKFSGFASGTRLIAKKYTNS